jgi:phospholipid/cholesterol/gamma-HCH transport system ATP-binding protein
LGSNHVLQNVSGKFFKGKTNLIIGASGTGKSVLLKCIVGLLKPEKGEIKFDNNRDFLNSDFQVQKEIRREMGMLFQGSALFDSLTVEENVLFPLHMLTKGMSKSEKLDRVHFCLKRVGLENASKLMPSELSGGMKKRVGIARAIVLNSKYLFCDEPNSGLDPQTSIVIDHLIKEITKEFQITTVVVTHDMNSVVNMGENIMFIHKGQNMWEGTFTDMYHTQITELDNFVFASDIMKGYKLSHQ